MPALSVRHLVLAVLACATVLSACGDDSGTLDQAATERAVGRAVAAEVDPAVRSTRCPGSLDRERGATFTCSVTLEGAGSLPVAVRQVDDEGALDVVPGAAVVTNERITSELRASLESQFERDFAVKCSGDAIEVRAPRSTSTCSAQDETSRRQVTVTVTDTAGTLSFAVDPPG